MEDKKESDEIDLKDVKDHIVKFTKGLFAGEKNKQYASHTEIFDEDSTEEKDLGKKREHLIHFLKEKKEYIVYTLLAFVIWVATSLRLQNLPLLIDVTTGKYIAADLDAFLFSRYANYILEYGKAMAQDMLRYAPLGHPDITQLAVEQGFPYFQVILYKTLKFIGQIVTLNFSNSLIPFLTFFALAVGTFFIVKKISSKKNAIISSMAILYTWILLNYVFKIFNKEFTFDYLNVIHTSIVFALTLIFFFLLVRRLFDNWTALIATTILAFMPAYLFRTMGGVADHDAAGMMFFMLVIYLYIVGWQSKNKLGNIFFGVLAGIATLGMFFTWPGGGSFLYLIFGTSIIIEIILNIFKKSDFYVYVSWFITWVSIELALGYLNIYYLFGSFTTQVAVLGFALCLIHYLFFVEHRINIKRLFKLDKLNLPEGILSILVTLILGVIALSIVEGPGFIFVKINQIYINLVRPWGISRWHLTVAEQNQPYLVDWFGQFSKNFVYIFMFGSILLFYEMLMPIKESLKKLRLAFISQYTLTIFYAAFIFSFTFSRYSQSSQFNGTSQISLVFYLGSLIVFVLGLGLLCLYIYYSNKNLFNEIATYLNKKYVLMFIWFIVMIIGARGAIRLVFVFAPVTAIIATFFFTDLLKRFSHIKQKYVKFFCTIVLILIFFSPVALGAYFNFPVIKPIVTLGGLIENQGIVFNYYFSTSSQAKYTGTPYDRQWQLAMKWVRDNTPLDAIFGHWWDYGYWVQTGGERATVTDGGNNIGLWNYYMGRFALAGQNQSEALDFLYAHNVTHFLIISDEIGKYTAFSSIGGGVNYERYSWINTFSINPKQTQETRNGVAYFYQGGQVLDEDFNYNGKLFPGRAAGIGAVLLKVIKEQITENNATKTVERLDQPEVIMVYGGLQEKVPLECIFINNQMFKFDKTGKPGYKGCFRILPTINGNGQVENPIGAGLMVSERGFMAIWTQLFLFNQKNPDYDTSAYKLAYSDEDKGMPLAIYAGRLIGPLKIWEINYPKDIEFKPEYMLRNYEQANLTAVTLV